MDFDNRWRALIRPGDASAYFEREGPAAFDVHAAAFSPANAWWLAEISRLIYREQDRDRHLRTAGLRESAFLSVGGTQCAVVRSGEGTAAPFTVLVFRGTDGPRDWITDLAAFHFPWRTGGIVHRGFAKALLSVWDRLEKILDPLDAPLFITGHSLGAALALLAASLRPPRALYTFGCPLTGDDDFAASMRGQRAYRVVNNLDLVTALPPRWTGFRHAGALHYIGRGSRLLVNPDPAAVVADREARARSVPPDPDARRRFAGPLQCMADHAPVNYVAHMERAASGEAGPTAAPPASIPWRSGGRSERGGP